MHPSLSFPTAGGGSAPPQVDPPAAPSPDAVRRPTGRSAWVALILVDLVLSAALVPSLLDDLRQRVPADIVAGVGDERLLDQALRIGAYLSVPVHAGVLIVIALVARSLERHVFPASRELGGSVRFGFFWLTVAATLLPLRLLDLSGVTLGGPAWALGPAHAGVVVGLSLVVFRAEWTRLTWSSRALSAGLAAVFVLALVWGK